MTGPLLVPLRLLGREKVLTEGAHSIQLVLPSPALPMARGTCRRALSP